MSKRIIQFEIIVVLFVCLCIAYTISYTTITNANLLTIANSSQIIGGRALTESPKGAAPRGKHGHYSLYHLWGWPLLTIVYWLKVKFVVVAFFVGTALFWGLKYLLQQRCSSEIVQTTAPLIYDHRAAIPHLHHDPYYHSQDISDSSFDNEPYSAYEKLYGDVTSPTSNDGHHLTKRSSSRQRKPLEEKIADVAFEFLGINSIACRRRFICEMEFRSNLHPLTKMAFRIIIRGFFEKYTNAYNTNGVATSFANCALINNGCSSIEDENE